MIKKCDKPGCTKAGTCRAPKSRDLKDYWFFCQEHAAEYNKNWNFYANMTPEEIEADWERQTFGQALKDKNAAKILKYFYEAFGNTFFYFYGFFNSSNITFDDILTLALNMEEDDFIVAAYEIIVSGSRNYSLKSGYVFVKYFAERKMHNEFKEAFKFFFNNDLSNYLICADYVCNVSEIKATLEIIDSYASGAENQRLKENYFLKCIDCFAMNLEKFKEERIKKLERFKEIGFKIKDATAVLPLVREPIEDDLFEYCKDLLEDDALLYVQKLTFFSVKEIHNKIDMLMKIKPNMRISIDDCAVVNNTPTFNDSNIHNVTFIQPILKKYKVVFTQSIKESNYIRAVLEKKSRAILPLIDYLYENRKESIDELTELFSEYKNFEALNYIMQHK